MDGEELMLAREYRESAAKRAADARSDLNMAAAIQYLCESSLFLTAAGHRFEARIVKLCREHGQLQLRAHDKAVGEIK
jgi:hypothetical protein